MEKSDHLELLACAGRLLLEHNESTRAIHSELRATAQALAAEDCDIAVSYNGIAIALGSAEPRLVPVREFRINMAVQAAVHSTLAQISRGHLDVPAALAKLKQCETNAPRHSRWIVVPMLSGAAVCLAALLGADRGAAIVAGVATGLGLAARLELGRRQFSFLTLPFVAALIGSILGGAAIRLGWTATPGLALVVPSLMLVPGPHFINSLLDVFDNYLPMAVVRLALAISIVMAATLGAVVGIELLLGDFPTAAPANDARRVTLLLDLILAGIVTCGFAAAYNTAWPHLAIAAGGGMIGHGLRYVALAAGSRLDAATFLGGLGIGIVSGLLVRATKTPFAVIAFAGAATMMPGLQVYRALGGAFQIAHLKEAGDPTAMAVALGNALQASIVLGALALGLVIGARTATLIPGMTTRTRSGKPAHHEPRQY